MPPDPNGNGAQGDQGAGGSGEPVYLSQLSPETRQDKAILEAIKDSPKLNDLVKNHAALKARMSRAIVVPNAEKPDAAEVKAFREAMGLPEKAEDYVFDSAAFKDVHGVEEVVAMARTNATAMGLTKVQAQKYFDSIMTLSKAGRDAMVSAREEERKNLPAKLVEAFKGDTAKADAAHNRAVNFLARFVKDKKILDDYRATGILYNPSHILTWAAIDEALGEEPFADGNRGGQKGEKRGRQGHYSPGFQDQFGKQGAKA